MDFMGYQMKIFINESTCNDALRDAILNKRVATTLELAIGLAVFYDQGSAEMREKKVLRMMYAGVEYDCADRLGDDYTTVDNKVRAIAGLYNKLGHKTITKWAKGKNDSEALTSIAKELEECYLYTFDAVRRYCRGEAVRQTGPKRAKKQYTPTDHPQRRQEDVEYADVIEQPHGKVLIQSEATYSEIMKMVKALTELANKRKFERQHLKAA